MNRVLPSVCVLFLFAARVSAAPPRVDDAFPPPADAAQRARLELDLSKHPTPIEIAWQKQGVYGFMHFGIATAGVGKPENFNLTKLDCRQWIKAYKAAGCQIVILTTKHHDGFCLWNSRYTKYSVAGSPWKDGKGDVIREFAEACREEGIQCGLYVSTADGSQRKERGGCYDNGSPAVESVIPTPVDSRPFPAGHKQFELKVDDYNRFTLNQLYELVTEYGPIAQIWFDAPVPPPGIKQTYNNDLWHNMVRELSPDTVLLGYSGGGVKRKPGDWHPREGIFTVVPAWFDRKDEDAKLTTVQYAVKSYFNCAARGAVFAPGVAPDSTGIVTEGYVNVLEKTGAIMRKTLGSQACALWNDGRPNPLNRAEGAPPALLDNNAATIWEPESSGPCEVNFKAKDKSNLFLIEEDVSQSQRVRGFTLERKAGDKWELIIAETYIGEKRILPISTIEAATELRLRITSSKARPRLAEIGLFLYEPLLMPAIHRGNDGRVVIEGPSDAAIHYTVDGSEPTAQSPVFGGPFDFPQGGLVRAVSVRGAEVSDCAAFEIGLPKAKWKVLAFNNEERDSPASAILDDDLTTEWHSPKEKAAAEDNLINSEIKEAWGVKSQKNKENPDCFLTMDLGETKTITGFTYYPGKTTANPKWSGLDRFTLHVGNTPDELKRPVASGLFFQDEESRQHVIHFAKPAAGRYFRLEAQKCNRSGLAAADIGLLGK